jgi:hypothetical protein
MVFMASGYPKNKPKYPKYSAKWCITKIVMSTRTEIY